MRLYAMVRPTSCCGLLEWHNLRLATEQPYGSYYDYLSLGSIIERYPGRAIFATTTVDQKAEAAALKELGFYKVDRWRNGNTGRNVTFWFFQPNPSKRKKK